MRFSRLLPVVGICMLTWAVALPAYAETAAADLKAKISAAKTKGEIGEMADGYLGVTTTASDASKSLVTEANKIRRSAFTKVAKNTGAKTEEVGMRAGKKLMAKAKAAGQFFNASGTWTKK